MSVYDLIERLAQERRERQEKFEEDVSGAISILDMGKLVPLSESGANISRLIQHTSNGSPFVIITAFMSGNSITVNKRRNGEMLVAFRAVKLGGILLQGRWREVRPDKTTVEAHETSFFFPWTDQSTLPDGESLKAYCIKLARKYEQNAFVYGDGTDVYVVDTFKNIGKLTKIGTQITVSQRAIEKALSSEDGGASRNHGHDFVFEGLRTPNSTISAMLMNHSGVYRI